MKKDKNDCSLQNLAMECNMNSYTRNYNFGYHSTDDQLRDKDNILSSSFFVCLFVVLTHTLCHKNKLVFVK